MASPGQKMVLITGCSSGIGLRMAVMLAKDEQKRYHVISTMRDLKRKDKLVEAAGDAYGKTLSLIVLDVCSDESVKECINGIKDRHVDVLRVVFNDVYAASKFAMEGFCESLAVQLLKFNVTQSEIDKLPRDAGGKLIYGWIGLHQDPNNKTAWKWSGGGHVTFQNWNDGEPVDYGGNENNAVLVWNEKWNNVSGISAYYFYCMDVTVVEEKMSWEDALNHCREKQTDLPSLLSESDRLLVQTHIKHKNIGDRVWMGLRFLGDRWMWVNGDPLEYEAWSQEGGQDHQCPVRKRCGALTKEGLWENWDCQDKLNFVCV